MSTITRLLTELRAMLGVVPRIDYVPPDVDKNAENERLRDELRRARAINARLRHTLNNMATKRNLAREPGPYQVGKVGT